AGLRRLDAYRFDRHVLFDADRAGGRLQLGVVAGVLDDEVSRGLDGKLSLGIDADLGPFRDDHRREVGLFGGCTHHTLLLPINAGGSGSKSLYSLTVRARMRSCASLLHW